jgi:hypothetical protein
MMMLTKQSDGRAKQAMAAVDERCLVDARYRNSARRVVMPGWMDGGGQRWMDGKGWMEREGSNQ